MERHLTAALAALRAARHPRALDALLAAWRTQRHPRVSALIEDVGALVPAAPVAGEDPAKAWRARAKSPAAADVGALLASLLDGVPVAEVGARVERLGELPPDPRVASRYLAMLRQPPFTASSHKHVWVELLRQLTEVHGDPRAVDAAAALAEGYTRVFGETVMGRWMQTKLGKVGRGLPADAPDRAALPAATEALLTALEGALPKPAAARAATATMATDGPEGAHLRAVADDPTDPARRDALRAWMTAQGGERAEFVALQERLHAGELLSLKDVLRVKKLLTSNARHWLGPLAPVVKSPRFERAFLVECLVAPTGTKTGAAVGDPRWATVETVHCGGTMKNKGNDLLLHPALGSLRRLTCAPEALVEALLHDPRERPLEAIACDAMHPRVLPETLRAPGLPRLRDLSVSCWYRDDAVSKYGATWRPPSVLRPFLQSPLAARLAVLRWAVHDTFVPDVAAELDAHAPPGFTARVDLYYLSLSRGPDGRWSRVEVDIERVDDELKYSNSKLRTALGLDPARVREVAVRVAAGQDASKLAAQVAAVRERFPRAEVTAAAG